MRKVLILSLAAAALLATTTASSAQSLANGRSGVHQADISTCSSNRRSCLSATAYRGHYTGGCHHACMRTGTWDTYGYYGRRVTGVVRE